MRIVATSDCHGMLPDAEVPSGDVLVIAGDVLPDGGVEDQRGDLVALDRYLAGLHESFGRHHEDGTWFLNAALCDGSYLAVNAPHVIDV